MRGVSYDANTVCNILLSSGTDGVDYELLCRVVVSDSREKDKTITILVREQ